VPGPGSAWDTGWRSAVSLMHYNNWLYYAGKSIVIDQI
jgi:hypothetical protein